LKRRVFIGEYEDFGVGNGTPLARLNSKSLEAQKHEAVWRMNRVDGTAVRLGVTAATPYRILKKPA
jgi:hypothetical protein